MTHISTYNKRKPERKEVKPERWPWIFFFWIFLSSGAGVCSREESTCSHAAQEAGAEQLLPVPAQRSTFQPAPGGSYPFFYWILELAVAVYSLSPSIFFLLLLHFIFPWLLFGKWRFTNNDPPLWQIVTVCRWRARCVQSCSCRQWMFV
jgi:hypothetical protein